MGPLAWPAETHLYVPTVSPETNTSALLHLHILTWLIQRSSADLFMCSLWSGTGIHAGEAAGSVGRGAMPGVMTSFRKTWLKNVYVLSRIAQSK